MSDPATEERNELLDELTEALNTWYEKESESIQAERDFIDKVVKSRSSAVNAVASNTAAARVLVLDDITSFLAGV
jgi:hypothetical protein